MSTTMTHTEQLPVLTQSIADQFLSKEKQSVLLKRRENFTRSTSIEKIRQFNNYLCSQHFYILPSLILWLKTSQTLLTSTMDKLIVFIKSMFLLCVLRDSVQKWAKLAVTGEIERLAQFYRLSKKDMRGAIRKINTSLTQTYEQLKYYSLVVCIYGGIFLIFCQLLSCVLLIFVKVPPVGFLFLVACVLVMAKIAVTVMFTSKKEQILTNLNPKTAEEKKRIRRQLTYIGKTISNIKLF